MINIQNLIQTSKDSWVLGAPTLVPDINKKSCALDGSKNAIWLFVLSYAATCSKKQHLLC